MSDSTAEFVEREADGWCVVEKEVRGPVAKGEARSSHAGDGPCQLDHTPGPGRDDSESETDDGDGNPAGSARSDPPNAANGDDVNQVSASPEPSGCHDKASGEMSVPYLAWTLMADTVPLVAPVALYRYIFHGTMGVQEMAVMAVFLSVAAKVAYNGIFGSSESLTSMSSS